MRLAVVLCGTLLLASCWPVRRKPAPPPPPQPAVQLPIQTVPPQRIEAPPEIIVPPAPKPEPPELPPPVREQPEAPPVRRPKAAPSAQPAPVPPPAAPVGPVPPPAPVPQLAPMLSAEQRRAYDSAIDELIGKAEQNLTRARTRSLSGQQRDMVARAEAFITQARQARKEDPAAAKSLAERAELLSREAAGQ